MANTKKRIDQNVSGSLAPFTFICVVTSLISFGLVSMFSSSYDLALSMKMLPTYFFLRQSIAVVIGLVIAIALQFIPKIIFKIFSLLGFLVTNVLLILALFNTNINLFIDQGIQSIMVIYVFSFISCLFMKKDYEKTKIIISTIFLVCFDILLFFNNYKSMFIISIILTLAIVFYIGVKFRYFLWALLITLLPTTLWFFTSKTRVNTLINYIKAENAGSISSTLAYDAIVRGGGFGLGLGKGVLKMQREVDTVHTTYIFASIVEELGLIGLTLLFIFFLMLFVLCFNNSKRLAYINEKGYSTFSFSLTIFLLLQVIFNIGVTLRLLSPSLASLLPFVSYNLAYISFLIIVMGIIYRLMRLTTEKQKMLIISDEVRDGNIVFFNEGYID